jgi:energy-coupling factor transporter ATP-binding protein EcfA2
MRFDDFLALAGRDFSSHDLVIFHGRSGSGKSTAIEFLRRNNPHVSYEVVDEITTFRDLGKLLRARRGPVLVATHVHPLWLRILKPFARAVIFRTDRDSAKLLRYFDARSISASSTAIALYVREFGATYTDAEVILERYPSASFDASYARFRKFCRLVARGSLP